jgi:general secretion pathway protein K
LDGAPFGCRIDEEATVTIAIQDEAGKVDINLGNERLLAAALQAAGASASEISSVIDRLVDFRDRDNLPRPGGAEEVDYRAAGLKHGPKNEEFVSIDELEQVLGFPPNLLRQLRPYVTVHSRVTGIDTTVAPLALLRALLARELGDAQTHSVPSDAPSDLQERTNAAAIAADLRVGSAQTVFSLTSVAVLKGGGRFVREASVRLSAGQDEPYRFLAWQRGEFLEGTVPKASDDPTSC